MMTEEAIWVGWVGGIAIGLFALLQHTLSNKQLGCSLAYGNFCGLASKLDYFHKDEYKSLFNWRFWFIVGIPLGGFLSVITSPDSQWEVSLLMGETYERVMPDNDFFKILIVSFGGILMGIGARMSGGCTSGHVIVGCSLLNPASLIAGVLFFAGGLLVVQLLFFLFAGS